MDHSMHHNMDHSSHAMPGMDHGGHAMPGMDHGGHGGMDHGASGCVGSMYLNGQVADLCILSERWRVTGVWSLLWSCAIIALAAVAFEWLRDRTRVFEATGQFHFALFARPTSPTNGGGSGGRVRLPTSRSGSPSPYDSTSFGASSRRRRAVRALLYALQVSVSFTLMLVFMTFNYWVMAAVVLGSGVGFYLFNEDPNGVAGKTMVCH